MQKETALAAAYQVAGRCLVLEGQLIWQCTTVFVALNSLILAGLHSSPGLPTWAYRGIIALGVVYGALWHFSMARAWNYHQYYIQIGRELEDALELGDLGVFTRGRTATEAGKHKVGGEDIQFTRTPIRAKYLADATTWLFVVVYGIVLIRTL